MKLALLFPGQGAQYPGMCQTLYKQYATVRETFEEASEILKFDIAKSCFEGETENCQDTRSNQINVLVSSISMYRMYQNEVGIIPDYMAGHSLGEYSALCCAGAIDFADVLQIVDRRGIMMNEVEGKQKSMMAAVYDMDKIALEKWCAHMSSSEELVVVSNYNSSGQLVVSGNINAVNRVMQTVGEQGYRAVPLNVKAAFHSPIFSGITPMLHEMLQEFSFHDPTVPVISNTTAVPYTSSVNIAENLVTHLTAPVRWQESMHYLVSNGVTGTIEIGPGHTLTSLLKNEYDEIHIYTFDDSNDRNYCDCWLNQSGMWTKRELLKHMRMCQKHAICTQNYNAEEHEYRKEVLKPYRELTKLMNEAETHAEFVTQARYQNMLGLMQKIWHGKKVPPLEQKLRLDAISRK